MASATEIDGVQPSRLFDRIRAEAERRRGELDPEALRIRGAWQTTYVIQLTNTATPMHLSYVVVQTLHQGCSYYEPAIETPGMSDDFLGRNALDDRLGSPCWDIACLDAVYGDLCGEPDAKHELDGPNWVKAIRRASAVTDEVMRLLKRRTGKGGQLSVVNVGVVGDFLAQLHEQPGIRVLASDYYQGVVGKQPSGVTVEHGSRTLELIAEADVAVVTGMALANGTLDSIIDTAAANDTGLVVFAETGAHFGREYCRAGIDVVVGEPLPFYLSGTGVSVLEVFRRAA